MLGAVEQLKLNTSLLPQLICLLVLFYCFNLNALKRLHSTVKLLEYDKKSDEGSNQVRQGDERESGKIVLKQVKWTFFMHIYDKQCGIMQKNQWKGSNFQIQCFYNGTSGALC